MSSAAQIAANRANAQLPTGHTSETGKSKSCLNGVKTGLTGATVQPLKTASLAPECELASLSPDFCLPR